MAGPSDPLQADRDRPGRANLADEVHGPDINAQFQRSGCHDDAGLSALEPFFCREADLPGETSVVSRDYLSP